MSDSIGRSRGQGAPQVTNRLVTLRLVNYTVKKVNLKRGKRKHDVLNVWKRKNKKSEKQILKRGVCDPESGTTAPTLTLSNLRDP